MAQIRGPFILPRTSPQICGVPGEVVLQSGGLWLFPPGEYLVTCGPNTVVQYFNSLLRIWLPTALPSPGLVQWVSADGGNYWLYNVSGTVSGVTVGTAGSGGTNGIGPVQTGTTIAFAAATAPGVTAQGYAIVGGAVPAPTVTMPGIDFLVPPVICCDPPPDGGIQATFVCALNATGGIASVTVVNPGAGYTRAPQFYIIPQPLYYQGAPRWPGDYPPWMPFEAYPPRWPWPAPGLVNVANVWPGTLFQPNVSNSQGALLTPNALIGSGTLTGVVVIYGGGNYAAAPAITITSSSSPPLTGAAATAVLPSTGGATPTPIAPAVDTSIVQAMVQ